MTAVTITLYFLSDCGLDGLENRKECLRLGLIHQLSHFYFMKLGIQLMLG